MSPRTTRPDSRQLQGLFPDLPATAVVELASSASQLTYRPGESIMGEHERWSPAVVAEGAARLTIRAHDGREATLRTIGRGALVGLVALFEPDYVAETHERRMVAVERSTLIFLDPQTLGRLCRQHCEFVFHLLAQTVQWGGALTDAAGQFAFMSVRQRLADHLLSVGVREEGGRLATRATQQQLANEIGTVREVVARILHDLRSEGLIEVSRGMVTVLDPERLATALSV